MNIGNATFYGRISSWESVFFVLFLLKINRIANIFLLFCIFLSKKLAIPKYFPNFAPEIKKK